MDSSVDYAARIAECKKSAAQDFASLVAGIRSDPQLGPAAAADFESEHLQPLAVFLPPAPDDVYTQVEVLLPQLSEHAADFARSLETLGGLIYLVKYGFEHCRQQPWCLSVMSINLGHAKKRAEFLTQCLQEHRPA